MLAKSRLLGLGSVLGVLASTGSPVTAQLNCQPIAYFDPPVSASITQAAQLDCATPFGRRLLVFLESILTFPMPGADLGASHGISFTPGLTLVLGQ